MPISAVDFLARQKVEANDTTFADANYNSFRDDALAELSSYVPADLTANLAIVPVTTSYSLPADFLTLTTQERSSVDQEPVYRLTTATNVVLLPTRDFHLTTTNLVLAVDPAVTATWVLTYGGLQTVTTLPNVLVRLALDLATERYYQRKATEAATFFSYTTGSISINKAEEESHWLSLAKERRAAFASAITGFTTARSFLGTFTIHRA